MLTQLCQELRNWWDVARWYGEFTVTDGAITWANGDALDLQSGQYFRIIDSVFNDGVYQFPETTLKDETFKGSVWALRIPPDVVALADEIAAWCAKYEAVDSQAMSPFISESFGGYTYSKAGRSNSGETSQPGWVGAFAHRLANYRKINGYWPRGVIR